MRQNRNHNPTPSRQAARPETPAGPLYEAADFVFVRAPLLPVEAYCNLGAQAGDGPTGNGESGTPAQAGPLSLTDPRIRLALAVGSNALIDALERFERSGLGRRDAERLQGKVLRYLIRMSTRPTPFGLFAGVALGEWGASTDLVITSTSARIRTRPDMAWLLALAFGLEKAPEVRRRLCMSANPAAVIRGDRVILSQRAPAADNETPPLVSVRATGVVKRALDLARAPVPYGDLAARLLETTPGATPEQVDKLLDELWEQTLLLTDLRPPLTTANPAQVLAGRLAGIPEAAGKREELQSVLDAAAAWDQLPREGGLSAYRPLLDRANALSSASDTPFQVDMAMALAGRCISAEVGAEAARAAELLLGMTSYTEGLSSLAEYRQAFTARYGFDREVPLLDLLDPDVGLGAPPVHGHMAGISPAKAAERSQLLLDLAAGALHGRRQTVQLDADTLERLRTWRLAPDKAPPSLDLNVFVAARSPEALDAGQFQVIVGPNLGAPAGGRNLGRFADLLAPDGPAALQRLARAEERYEPGRIWAELVYLPAHFRSANVVVRPPVRSHEVALAVSPGVSPSQVIPLGELVVGMRNGRFYFRWPAAGMDVVFTAGHMLNNMNAPAVARFLIDASSDGIAVLSAFDWGPAENLPFLPRVEAGRAVLRPAQWRVTRRELWTEGPEAFRQNVEQWRARWDVPRYVCLSMADNRLILDLEEEMQREELRAELRDLKPETAYLVLQEVLPSFDQVWTPGPEGHYVIELVVSLLLRDGRVRPAGQSDVAAAAPHPDDPAPPRAAEEALPLNSSVPAMVRLRAPGSDWLFVKLYGPRSTEENLISGPLSNFAAYVLGAGLAEEWFFIRYSDPDPHVRLRFRGQPDRLFRELGPAVCAWAGELMKNGSCLRFSFDTYDREIERYGGPEGMAVAESLFCADSPATAGLLSLVQSKQLQLDRMTLAIASVDALLAGLELSEAERLEWYSRQTNAWDEVGQEYRQRKTLLRSLLSGPTGWTDQPAGEQVTRIFTARNQALAPVAERLRGLTESGLLRQTPATVYSSYVHLHLNRLAGPDSNSERSVLGLLWRTRDGLNRSGRG